VKLQRIVEAWQGINWDFFSFFFLYTWRWCFSNEGSKILRCALRRLGLCSETVWQEQSLGLKPFCAGDFILLTGAFWLLCRSFLQHLCRWLEILFSFFFIYSTAGCQLRGQLMAQRCTVISCGSLRVMTAMHGTWWDRSLLGAFLQSQSLAFHLCRDVFMYQTIWTRHLNVAKPSPLSSVRFLQFTSSCSNQMFKTWQPGDPEWLWTCSVTACLAVEMLNGLWNLASERFSKDICHSPSDVAEDLENKVGIFSEVVRQN